MIRAHRESDTGASWCVGEDEVDATIRVTGTAIYSETGEGSADDAVEIAGVDVSLADLRRVAPDLADAIVDAICDAGAAEAEG